MLYKNALSLEKRGAQVIVSPKESIKFVDEILKELEEVDEEEVAEETDDEEVTDDEERGRLCGTRWREPCRHQRLLVQRRQRSQRTKKRSWLAATWGRSCPCR